MVSLMFIAEQDTKQRKSSIKLAARRSANRRQNKDEDNRYNCEDIHNSLMPKARSAAQRSANRRQNICNTYENQQNNQNTYDIHLNELHTLRDLSMYLYYISCLIYKKDFSEKLKTFTSYSQMVERIQNILPKTIHIEINSKQDKLDLYCV